MTLRSADDLVEAGLIPPGLRDAIATVERRYAVAITPAMQALIQEPTIRSGCSSSPTRQN